MKSIVLSLLMQFKYSHFANTVNVLLTVIMYQSSVRTAVSSSYFSFVCRSAGDLPNFVWIDTLLDEHNKVKRPVSCCNLITSVPSEVRNRANAQHHQTLCAVKSHSRALVTYYRFNIVSILYGPCDASLFVCLRGCAIACALKQTFALCEIFLEGTLLIRSPVCKRGHREPL